jgi:hypothetical protein
MFAFGEAMMTRIVALGSILRGLGPFLLIELLLPGGTLIALLLYVFSRRGSYPQFETLFGRFRCKRSNAACR